MTNEEFYKTYIEPNLKQEWFFFVVRDSWTVPSIQEIPKLTPEGWQLKMSYHAPTSGVLFKYTRSNMPRTIVYDKINGEREYQEKVWGDTGERRTNPNTDQNSKHDVGEWIVFMEHYLTQAKQRLSLEHGPSGSLDALRKVAGLAVACFEQHGCPDRGSYEGSIK